MDSRLLAVLPLVSAGAIGLIVAYSTGRLDDCWAALFGRAPEPDVEPTASDRARELVRQATRTSGIFGFADVCVERVPNGYRVVAGSVAVIYASSTSAEQAITRWLTRGRP